MSSLQSVAAAWPFDVTVSDDYRRVIRFLDWEVDPATVVGAGYGLGVAVAAVGLLAPSAVPGRPSPVGAAATLAGALGATHLVHASPRLLATARRTRALGTAPVLVVFAVLRMRLAPSRERAAAFAASAGPGPLADSLEAHARAAQATNRSGFERFGAEWAEWFPALARAVDLLTVAARVPPEDRDRTLDRALDVVLDGTARQMRSYSSALHGPATVIYAFGVLLPVALVSLLPAARASGLAVTLPMVVALYDIALPLLLVAAGAWLLSRRPVAFPPPDLGPGHPDVPDRVASAIGAGCVAGAFAAVGTAAVLPSWAPPIAGSGVGLGTGLLVRYRPYEDVRARIRAVEAGLPDALAVVGRRVSNGVAVERAIESAGADLDGPAGTVLARGASRQTALDVGVERAFLGENGAIETIPSPRVRGSVGLLAVAAREGRPAGDALLALATHLEDVQRVERQSRADLGTVVETLRSTGAYFGPLVGGATVALAGHMTTEPGFGELTAGGIPWLGLAVGGYVLAMAAILTTLSIGLERGLDRPLVGVRVGWSLLAATGSYLVGYLLAAAVA